MLVKLTPLRYSRLDESSSAAGSSSAGNSNRVWRWPGSGPGARCSGVGRFWEGPRTPATICLSVVNFTHNLRTAFLIAFSCQKWQTQTLKYRKAAHKMLVKLTPVGSLRCEWRSCISWGRELSSWYHISCCSLLAYSLSRELISKVFYPVPLSLVTSLMFFLSLWWR